MFRVVVVNDNSGNVLPGIFIRPRTTRNDQGFELASVMIADDATGGVFIRDIPNVPSPSGPQAEGYSWRELTQNERNGYNSSLTKISDSFGQELAEGGISTIQTPTTDF